VSIESLIDHFGQTLYLYAPTYTTATDGTVVRTFSRSSTTVGMVMPASQSQTVALDRMEQRGTVAIYFKAGTADSIDVDWEIRTAELGPYRRFLVTGRNIPGDLDQSGASPHLRMLVVDAIEVTPEAGEELV